MEMVYSMWLSSVNPTGGMSGARSSALPVSSSVLLPAAILKLIWRREKSDFAPDV